MIIRLLVRLMIRLRHVRGIELVPMTIPAMVLILIDRLRVMRWTRKLLSWRRWLVLHMRMLHMRMLHMRMLHMRMLHMRMLHMRMPTPPLLLATATPGACKVLRLQCHGPMLLPYTPASWATAATATTTPTLPRTVISTITLFHPVLASLAHAPGNEESARANIRAQTLSTHTLAQAIPCLE